MGKIVDCKLSRVKMEREGKREREGGGREGGRDREGGREVFGKDVASNVARN